MKINDERKVCTYKLEDAEAGDIVEIKDILYLVTAEDNYDKSDNKLILVVNIDNGKTIWMYEDTGVIFIDATFTIKTFTTN